MKPRSAAFSMSVPVGLILFCFFIGCFPGHGPRRPTGDVVAMATAAREKGDLDTAVKLLTAEIERGIVNGRRLGLLFAMRATLRGEAGAFNTALDDCVTALQLIPNGKDHEDIKRLMDALRYQMADSVVSGGIPIKQGWNGLKWGAPIEAFKARFPKHIKKERNWETGEGKESFCGVWVDARYWFNSKGEFYYVALFPSETDRQRLLQAMTTAFGWPSTNKRIWHHENIEIKCMNQGIVALVLSTRFRPDTQQRPPALADPSTQGNDNASGKVQKTLVGVINEINLDWRLVIVRLNGGTAVNVQDTIVSYDNSGKAVTMMVEKLVAGKAVAKLPMEIIRKLNLKSEVFKIESSGP